MTRTVRISAIAHQKAKQRANRVGMKLYRFIEAAIQAFDPARADDQQPQRSRNQRKPVETSRP